MFFPRLATRTTCQGVAVLPLRRLLPALAALTRRPSRLPARAQVFAAAAAAMSAPTRFAGTTGHPVGETKTNLAVGMDKGKVVTKMEQKPKPSHRKGKLNNRVKFVREVIREVVGFSPYEKRTMELLKVGKEKRALKLLKAKLGARPAAKTARCAAPRRDTPRRPSPRLRLASPSPRLASPRLAVALPP